MESSSSGLGYLIFTQAGAGSNPVDSTIPISIYLRTDREYGTFPYRHVGRVLSNLMLSGSFPL